MATETKEKPSYLGLLNSISLGESRAGVYLKAWADVTPDPDLACALRLVAARETSHGDVFCRRIQELGFDVLQKPDAESAKRLARFASPDVSDLEKVGPKRQNDGPDFFAGIEKQMEDGIFDPLTCQLLSWYIAEERDSGKLLEAAYDCVRERAGASSNGTASNGSDTKVLIDCMTSGFDRLEKAIGELVAANGKRKN
jgi:hypothetical protein